MVILLLSNIPRWHDNGISKDPPPHVGEFTHRGLSYMDPKLFWVDAGLTGVCDMHVSFVRGNGYSGGASGVGDASSLDIRDECWYTSTYIAHFKGPVLISW